MKTASSKLVRRHSHAFRPQVEALEDRFCLSCTFLPKGLGGVLVLGDTANNTVGILDDGTAGAKNIVISCDGVTKEFSGIKSVRVDTGEGDDVVEYGFTKGNMTLSSPRTVRVNLGNGDDRFLLQQDDLTTFCKFYLDVHGDAGNDNLSAASGLETHAPFKVRLRGDAGEDEVFSRFSLRSGSVDVVLLGGDGDDLLNLTVENGRAGVINGERDTDTCIAVGSVTKIGCEL